MARVFLGSRRNRQVGLSLIEVMAAVGLLGAGVMPVAYIASSGTRNAVASYGLLTASALGVQLVDRVVDMSYTDSRIQATTGFVNPSSTLSNANPLTAAGMTWAGCSGTCGFTRTWRITDKTPLSYTKTIEVRVAWTEYGLARTIQFSTIKAVN